MSQKGYKGYNGTLQRFNAMPHASFCSTSLSDFFWPTDITFSLLCRFHR